jgi:hypothetical protein
MKFGNNTGRSDQIRRRQDFDGDLALQVRVGGLVDFAHATHADQSDDFVGAKACAGNQGQVCGLYEPDRQHRRITAHR